MDGQQSVRLSQGGDAVEAHSLTCSKCWANCCRADNQVITASRHLCIIYDFQYPHPWLEAGKEQDVFGFGDIWKLGLRLPYTLSGPVQSLSSPSWAIIFAYTIKLICCESCPKNSIKLNRSVSEVRSGPRNQKRETLWVNRMWRMGRTGIYDLVRRFICYCWWFILNRNEIEGQTCVKEILVETFPFHWGRRRPHSSSLVVLNGRSPQNHRVSWTCDLLCTWSGSSSCKKKQIRRVSHKLI